MLVMLIIWLLFIIGFTIFGWIDEGEPAAGGFLGGLIGIIPAWLIGGLISIALFGTAPSECKYQRDLVAMKDNTAISGSFFLGCGRIDSEMTYIYAAETDKGIATYTLERDRNNVYIKYTDGQPYMEYWAHEEDPWRLAEESSYYVFYLPEGSVVNTYEIDLE